MSSSMARLQMDFIAVVVTVVLKLGTLWTKVEDISAERQAVSSRVPIDSSS